jgi:CRP-like cAMP-binding protein
MKMSRATFMRSMRSMPAFERLASAYVQAFIEQLMASVACNGAHKLKQRLARWLLMMRDRSDEDTLHISQRLLAKMLGVERPSITIVARDLQRVGLIAGFQPLRTAIASDCGQWFQLIADSIATIADR